MDNLMKIFKDQQKVKLSGNIYHKTQIELAYNSNRIEGSTLTHEQTRYMYETKTIDGIALVNDVIEMQNHFRLFDYMLDTVEDELSEQIIKEYHKILKTHTHDSEYFNVGEYKNLPNEVGGNITAQPSEVPIKMRELLSHYNKKDEHSMEAIIDFHYQFESIHPFQDGNGRVGRMIMFKECLKYKIIPFIIQDEYKLFYYRGLQNYKTEEGFLVDTCLNAQDIYQDYIKALLPEFEMPKSQPPRGNKS